MSVDGQDRESTAEVPAPSDAAPRVLVVDDDRDVRKTLTAILHAERFDVLAVADGDAALRSVEEGAPDVVILDLKMPGRDGLETLKQLKAIAADVPVIILTGYGDVASAV